MSDPKVVKIKSPFMNIFNVDYIEDIHDEHNLDPQNKIDPSWHYFFQGMEFSKEVVKEKITETENLDKDLDFELKVIQLIQGYRELGHLIADVNPLDRGEKSYPLLELSHFGLSESDLERSSDVAKLLGFENGTLKDLINALKDYYCSPVAVEYDHIGDPISRRWIQSRVESDALKKPISKRQRLKALHKLIEAESFENFLQKRFIGQKRFSVEGLDVVIPMLDFIIEQSSDLGADELILCMAHRGRLNVLANIFQKDLSMMLAEFVGKMDAEMGEGDVKYHMGFSQNVNTSKGRSIHLSLTPNPSHLEAVNAVLLGITRSKQTLKRDLDRTRTLPVMIHGDAAFSGQGSVYEVLNMSELEGYKVGGTIHIILNNQVGFTTNPHEGRSTPHATDVAKMLEVPIFRVNADEPEAVLRCTLLALQFRYTFKRDVIIDLMGYRRYGHNESDEPTFTQPLMYEKIKRHTRVADTYIKKLLEETTIDQKYVDEIKEDEEKKLEKALAHSRENQYSNPMDSFSARWHKFTQPTDEAIFEKIKTGVHTDELTEMGLRLLNLPANFHIHPKIRRSLDNQREILNNTSPVDWSMGEALTYASLLCEGHAVRLAGQDSERGTFSHRHAVYHDIKTGSTFTPLNHIQEDQAHFEVINSPLSEFAALGFEFGQSLANPSKLTIWEAQFGDFVNGAQVIIDQFLTSSAAKWKRFSGLVLLLPHGYEGQGPEHSSARLERFLQACGTHNIQVCNLTSPSQFFHVMRRQLHRSFRMPLIIMSPKSLLRHPEVISPLSDLENDVFHEVIDDNSKLNPEKIDRIILCSGKIYFELKSKRNEAKLKNKNKEEIIWCQEEPKNMGAWTFMLERLTPLLPKKFKLEYVGRQRQANPSDGYLHTHKKEQSRIIETALGLIKK
jgi:2-oxoglutarate dehydrogenase E1 component